MHIGILVPPWASVPPRGYGAIEMLAGWLAVRVQAAGHRVTLVTTGDSTCPVPRLAPFPQARPQEAGNTSTELVHVLEAYDELAGLDLDLLHDHSLTGPVLAAARPPAWPVVTTAHWTLEGHIGRMYERMGRALPLLAISEAQRSSAPAVRFADMIYHGVDTDQVPVGPGGGPLAFVGRMSADKGVHTAITTARAAGRPIRVAAKMTTFEERRYFEEAVRPLLGPDAEYVGELDRPDVLRLLGEATAMLMPVAWHEPFGLVAVEALACGTPVLATPRGALPEIVEPGRTGYLCPDGPALAAAVGRVGELSRADCRRSAETRFSADRMAAEHLRFYARVLGDPVTTPGPAHRARGTG